MKYLLLTKQRSNDSIVSNIDFYKSYTIITSFIKLYKIAAKDLDIKIILIYHLLDVWSILMMILYTGRGANFSFCPFLSQTISIQRAVLSSWLLYFENLVNWG